MIDYRLMIIDYRISTAKWGSIQKSKINNPTSVEKRQCNE